MQAFNYVPAVIYHPITVRAVEPVPGLVVHRELVGHPGKPTREGSGWVITHKASGARIAMAATFKSRRAACAAARKVAAPAFDWTKSEREIRAEPNSGHRGAEMRRKLERLSLPD